MTKKTTYWAEYRKRLKDRGFDFHTFILPVEIIPEVKDLIKKRIVELGKRDVVEKEQHEKKTEGRANIHVEPSNDPGPVQRNLVTEEVI